jgi:hypothetical protein
MSASFVKWTAGGYQAADQISLNRRSARRTCVLQVLLATVPFAMASQGVPVPLAGVVTTYVDSCRPPLHAAEQALQGIQEATQSTANNTDPA